MTSSQKPPADIFFFQQKSTDTRGHGSRPGGSGAKFLLLKMSASGFRYEKKSAFMRCFQSGVNLHYL